MLETFFIATTRGCYRYLVCRARYAAKYPTLHRQVLQKNYLIQNGNSWKASWKLLTCVLLYFILHFYFILFETEFKMSVKIYCPGWSQTPGLLHQRPEYWDYRFMQKRNFYSEAKISNYLTSYTESVHQSYLYSCIIYALKYQVKVNN